MGLGLGLRLGLGLGFELGLRALGEGVRLVAPREQQLIVLAQAAQLAWVG